MQHLGRLATMRVAFGPGRWTRVLAGTLLRLLAFYSYWAYDRRLNQDLADAASVPRLQIADLKVMLMYDSSVASEHTPIVVPNQKRDAGPCTLYLIDVRSKVAYDEGHIPGAISILEAELQASIGAIVPPNGSDALIVLYCG